MRLARALGLVLGVAADAIFADPTRNHPVAWFGTAASKVESHTWRDSKAAGLAHLGVTVLPVVGTGWLAQRAVRGSVVAETLLTAIATWAVLGAESLREATGMADELTEEDLVAARDRVTHLCGRDPTNLDEAELARATVESVAENTADAAVASLLSGAVFGLPGLLGHRAINTLDAMIGHKNARYRNFGWAAARLDDLVCLIPARVTAGLATVLAPVVGGDTVTTARIVGRDGDDHPSPNGGWCEAAFAGALGVKLGGTNVYFGRSEVRGQLGDGEPPTADSVRRAAKLSSAVVIATTVLSAGWALLRPRPTRRSS